MGLGEGACCSIDKHKTQDRGFINDCSSMDSAARGGDLLSANLADDAAYDIYRAPTVAAARRLPEANAQCDDGSSWAEMDRFFPFQFGSGGSFKACFCDKDLLGTSSLCKNLEDFKVEIGFVQVSGVSCLLEDERFQRGFCEQHYRFDDTAPHSWGLRCYGDSAPHLTYPIERCDAVTHGWQYRELDLPDSYEEAEQADGTPSVYCLYGPEDNGAHSCQTIVSP